VIGHVLRASALFRRRFGNLSGFLFWASLLREKLYPKGDLFSVGIPGIKTKVLLRAHTSDVETLCQIFCHAELDVPVTHKVSYIIDAGANIGLASVFLANRFPSARIDALEVDEGNLRILQLNARPYSNLVVHPKGLWSHKAQLKVINCDAEPWAFRVRETEIGELGGIPAVSVQDLVEASGAGGIDILKMDIEGAEVEVLGTSKPWMHKVRMLLVELHDRDRPGCSDALRSAISGTSHALGRSG
jgi:FkbM family methyltransferase